MSDLETGLPSEIKSRKKTARVLLDSDSSASIYEYLSKLRTEACRADASKLVNQILRIYFSKYREQDHKAVFDAFFDKKKYLRSLLEEKSESEVDEAISKYLKQAKRKIAK